MRRDVVSSDVAHTKRNVLEAVFTVVTASASFDDDVKEWSEPFFDAHLLGVRLKFDVDVKILLNFDVDGTNVKTAIQALEVPQ